MVFRRYKSAAQLQKQADSFNRKHPVGKRCFLTLDGGKEIETAVRSKATLQSGEVVAWFDGVSGSYLIEGRVRQAPPRRRSIEIRIGNHVRKDQWESLQTDFNEKLVLHPLIIWECSSGWSIRNDFSPDEVARIESILTGCSQVKEWQVIGIVVK